MKKLWLLVFPICMLLSCLTACRPPIGGAISIWSPNGTLLPPSPFVEEGGKLYFMANHPFLIRWCNGAKCKPKDFPPDLGPCTKKVEATGPEKADGHDRFVGTCKIANRASKHTDYRYAFHFTGKTPLEKDPDPIDFPDNLQPCNPRCSPKSN